MITVTGSNHNDRPILRRILATTHRRDSVCSTSNGTLASFHSCSSIIAHVESRISRRIVVNETPGGVSDGPENEEGNQIEEIEGSEDIPARDDDSPIHHDRTYQFDNCHVYLNSFNVRGVKVKNSGNNTQRARVTHGGTAPIKGPPLSSKLSRPSTRPKGPRNQVPAFGQSSHRHQDFRPDSTFGSPPPLLFQLREDNSLYASDDFPSAPPVGMDVAFPTFEQKQPTKRDKLPATGDTRLMQIMQSNPVPARAATLPGPESQPHPIHLNHFLPIHMGLHPNPATPNLSQHRPDTNLKSLEHHLNSALSILIQTSGGSILGDGVTPQARNTLKAINALVSMEKPTSTVTRTYDPPPRFKFVKKLAKWLQIP